MITMEQAVVTPEFIGSFAGILQRHKLLPDEWLDQERALAAIMGSEFFILRAGDRVLGLAWIEDLIPGHSCRLGIIMEAKYRKWMLRPGKVTRKRSPMSIGKAELRHEILSRCFDTHGVRRVEVRIPASRAMAKRLAASCGFEFEGTLHGAASFEGQVQDIAIYGMTKEDWYG